MDWLLTLDALGTICGLVYLYLEYNARIQLWLVSMVMPAIDIFVYFQAGLYADFGMAIYYLLAAIYGWAVWRGIFGRGDNGSSRKEELPITRFPHKGILLIFGVFIAIWVVMYWVLTTFTNSTVPFVDSLANSLSIVALWMLSRKYVEQWLLWFVVDAILCVLYIYKGVPFHGILYGFYTVMAIIGYRKWVSLMSEKQ